MIRRGISIDTSKEEKEEEEEEKSSHQLMEIKSHFTTDELIPHTEDIH